MSFISRWQLQMNLSCLLSWSLWNNFAHTTLNILKDESELWRQISHSDVLHSWHSADVSRVLCAAECMPLIYCCQRLLWKLLDVCLLSALPVSCSSQDTPWRHVTRKSQLSPASPSKHCHNWLNFSYMEFGLILYKINLVQHQNFKPASSHLLMMNAWEPGLGSNTFDQICQIHPNTPIKYKHKYLILWFFKYKYRYLRI